MAVNKIASIPSDKTNFELTLSTLFTDYKINDLGTINPVSPKGSGNGNTNRGFAFIEGQGDKAKSFEELFVEKVEQAINQHSGYLMVDYDESAKKTRSLFELLCDVIPSDGGRANEDVYLSTARLLSQEPAQNAESISRTLRNWNDSGASFGRGDSYELLIRLLFVLKLPYKDCLSFMDNIGARHLYALDCHEHVLILALIVNELIEEHNSNLPDNANDKKQPKISYEQALLIAKDSEKYVQEAIEDRLQEVIEANPGMDHITACAYTLRSMYSDARSDAADQGYIVNNITQFTRYTEDSMEDIAYERQTIAFDELARRSIKINTAQMLRMRKNLIAVMAEYFCGSRDFANIDLTKCIWMTQKQIDDSAGVKDHQKILKWMKKAFMKDGLLNSGNSNFSEESIWAWLGHFTTDVSETLLVSLLASDESEQVASLVAAGIAAKFEDLDEMHEDVARESIGKLSAKTFSSAFTTSLTSFITGRVKKSPKDNRLSRKRLMEYCLRTGRITRTQVNRLLAAAGEAPLNGLIKSDYNMLAIVMFCEWVASELYKDEFDDSKLRLIYHKYFNLFSSLFFV